MSALVEVGLPRYVRMAIIECAVVHNEFTKSQDFSLASYRIGALAEVKDIVLGLRSDAGVGPSSDGNGARNLG